MERRRDEEGEKKGKIGKLTWHPAIVIYLIPLTEHAAKLTETRSRMIFMVLQETASHSVKKVSMKNVTRVRTCSGSWGLRGKRDCHS